MVKYERSIKSYAFILNEWNWNTIEVNLICKCFQMIHESQHLNCYTLPINILVMNRACNC